MTQKAALNIRINSRTIGQSGIWALDQGRNVAERPEEALREWLRQNEAEA